MPVLVVYLVEEKARVRAVAAVVGQPITENKVMGRNDIEKSDSVASTLFGLHGRWSQVLLHGIKTFKKNNFFQKIGIWNSRELMFKFK